MSTDYDCWHEDETPVTVEQVVANLDANSNNAKLLILAALPELEQAINAGKLDSLKGSMKFACVTANDKRSKQAVERVDYILPEYF
jgi:5'-methylthioadenosine phosphorylase